MSNFFIADVGGFDATCFATRFFTWSLPMKVRRPLYNDRFRLTMFVKDVQQGSFREHLNHLPRVRMRVSYRSSRKACYVLLHFTSAGVLFSFSTKHNPLGTAILRPRVDDLLDPRRRAISREKPIDSPNPLKTCCGVTVRLPGRSLNWSLFGITRQNCASLYRISRHGKPLFKISAPYVSHWI